MSGIYRAYLEHEDVIRRVIARYCPRPEDVDDLAQQTFLKSFAAELKGEIREPKAFLIRVARNLCLSEVKRHVHTRTDSLEDFESSDVLKDERHANTEDRIDARRKLEIVAGALASLPPDCRKAFVMRKMEGLRMKQIATRTNVSISTAEKRVARALVLCNAYLREQGYDPAEFGSAIGAKTPKSEAREEGAANQDANSNECENHD